MHRIRHFIFAIASVALLAAGAAQAAGSRYQVNKLASDIPGMAANTNAKLQNPWGIAFNPTGFDWIANNATASSSLLDGDGVPNPTLPFVNVPGNPTGIVFNGTKDFPVTKGNPAAFIFASEDGSIAAWSPAVDLHNAMTVVPSAGAVYKGLALAANGTANFLYAADFLHRRIDVYDANFHLVSMPFSDPKIPAQFSPFNITNIKGDLYVAYAERLGNDTDETAGPGLGFVDVFDANGILIRRVASRGQLNAPWGMVLAPASFGKFADRLLVGNFGDGTINAFDAHSGEFKGTLRGADNKPIKIDGLWGLAFGNGVLNQPTSTLFFAAGIDDEAHGLYGSIAPLPPKPGEDDGNDDSGD
jgi:uncharacterized protein (TIGR03118 family)